MDIKICRIFQCFANFTNAARRSVYRLFAVDCRREDFRYTRFTRTTRTAKKIRVSDFTRRDLVFEYGYDMFLPNDVVKRCRTKRPI